MANAAPIESEGDSPPAMIDRYELLRKLATGGMAELFLAKQSGLEGFEKVVVLKRILSNLASDEEFVNMFLDEARIAAKLSHPNIVQIYDLGKADDSYYIAMEYVSGRNVQHLIEKEDESSSKIPVEHVLRIVAGVCDGLYFAHQRKDYDGKPLEIVHRDVSPQNILVSFAGGVKVVDFGIAKASTQLAQTRAGVLKGKYAYMSPEQVRGAKIDHRADLFAVGLVMYEMLTGTRAFERESSLKTLKAIVQEKPLNPRELNPDVPMEVVKLLSKALEKNPDRRYKNAQEMQLAIEDYLDRSPKKSNNIRLSRYLYELFDDELNSKDGTMIVQGVGEVIIPTGHEGEEEREPMIEEEIDSKTLSAALMPAAPEDADADKKKKKQAELKKQSRKARPKAKVTHEDPAPQGKRDEEWKSAATQKQPKAGDDATDAGVNLDGLMPDDLEDSDEEVEDKTIPVYDLAEYERHRGGKDDEDNGKDVRATLNDADVSDSFDEDAPTAAGLPAGGDPAFAPPTRTQGDATAQAPDDEPTMAVMDDGAAQARMMRDHTGTHTEELAADDLLAPSQEDPDWEPATTNEAPGGTLPEAAAAVTDPRAPPRARSPSSAGAPRRHPVSGEIVPGLTGPPPITGEQNVGSGAIRSAATAGYRPAGAAGSSTSTPIAPAAPLASGPGPAALPSEPTPETRNLPAAQFAPPMGQTGQTAPAPPASGGGIPMIYLAAGGATALFIFMALAIAIIFLVFVPTPGGGGRPASVQIMQPMGASITIDGKLQQYKVPTVLPIARGLHTIVLTPTEGAAVTHQINVDGSQQIFKLEAQPGAP